VAKVEDLVDIQSEAGVIASIIQKPDFLLFSENLKPIHFSDTANGALFDAISQLYNSGVERIDSFNLIGAINRSAKIKKIIEREFTDDTITELINTSPIISRTETADYELLVKHVIGLSYRREMFKSLGLLRTKCLNEDVSVEDLTKDINDRIDQSVMDYVIYDEPVLLADICDDLWAKTQSKRRKGGVYGFPSVISAFGDYFSYEPAELVLVSAKPKKGKSIFLMNEAVNMAYNHGLSVLYVDSELSTEQFQLRVMAHLSGIPVHMLKSGNFDELSPYKLKTVDKDIQNAVNMIKKMKLRHIFKPTYDKDWLLATCKKLKKEKKIDALVYDYFKGVASKGDDASSIYIGLGRAIDVVKNLIVGELELIGLAACQSNREGEVADSINLERSCSTLIFLENKTNKDIDKDGDQCGNTRFRVAANRNGGQMDRDEWIDASFDGDGCKFSDCEQHVNDSFI